MKLPNFQFEQLSISKSNSLKGGQTETHTMGSHTCSIAPDSDSGTNDADPHNGGNTLVIAKEE